MGILMRSIWSLIVSILIVGFFLLVTAMLLSPDWFVNFWEMVGMVSLVILIATIIDKYNFRG